jgi:aminoglycoside 6'-N-acetyltransferase
MGVWGLRVADSPVPRRSDRFHSRPSKIGQDSCVSTTDDSLPHPVIEGINVVVRPTTAADLELLVEWFERPDVVKYWGGTPLSEEEVEAKYIGRRRPAVECFIVQTGDTPAGLLQYHTDGERRGGIDMVLLEEHRGRGVGRAAVHAVVEFLLGQLQWSEITVDPDDSNADGKAFWASVGFGTVALVVDDADRDPYVLMRWNGRR